MTKHINKSITTKSRGVKEQSNMKKRVVRTVNVEYDAEFDILAIDKVGSKISYSIGDDILILDFNKKKEVVGLEIIDFCKMFNLSQDNMKNLKKLKVEIQHKKDERRVLVKIEMMIDKSATKLVIPVENTFNSDINTNLLCA